MIEPSDRRAERETHPRQAAHVQPGISRSSPAPHGEYVRSSAEYSGYRGPARDGRYAPLAAVIGTVASCTAPRTLDPLIALHRQDGDLAGEGGSCNTVRCRVHVEHVMATGNVKWFNPQKGFGFIQPEDGGKDVFVHISAVEQAGMSTLSDGQKVTFDLEQGRQGKTSAVNLKAVLGVPA